MHSNLDVLILAETGTALIRAIMFCVFLAIDLVAAVPVSGKTSWKGETHMLLQNHHRIILPLQNIHSLIESIDDNRHRLVKPPPVEPRQLRLQSSAFGRMASRAVRGFVMATTNSFSDHVSDELTRNDKDHPQKTKEQLEAENDD